MMNRQQRRAAERANTRIRRDGGRQGSFAPAARQLLTTGHVRDAEDLARRGVAADPSAVDVRLVLVDSLREQGRLDEAMLEARRAVGQAPTRPEAHEVLGRILLAQDRVVEAAAAFERAVELAPERAEAHQGLGTAMYEAGLLDRAEERFELVVRLVPRDPAAYLNLCAVRLAMGDFEAAGDAIASVPGSVRGPWNDQLAWNGALAALGTGDLRQAWSGYEAGFAAGARTPQRELPMPQWRGEELSDRSILVWREQGLADELMFATCLPDLAALAREVIFECSPRLANLLGRSLPGVTVCPEPAGAQPDSAEATPRLADRHTPIGSLPRYLRTTLAAFGEREACLVADPERREVFRDRLARLGPTLKVGLSWRSMNLQTSRLAHYLTLEELAPIFGVEGISFVNLQYGPPDLLERELTDLEKRTGVVVHRWSDIDYTDDLEAVAALTAELDLVLGPGSFPTSLAAALGVPTVVCSAPTVYSLGADHDPWFPAIRRLIRPWDQPWSVPLEVAADVVRDAVVRHADRRYAERSTP